MVGTREIKGPDAFTMVRSKAFDCYSMSAAYKGISRETQIDFSTVIAFLECMPTFLNGAAHRQKRSELARIYGSKTRGLKENVAQTVTNLADGLHTHSGAFDVLNNLALPIWRAVAEVLLPEHLSYEQEFEQLPDLFTPHTSLLKRKRCENFLRELVSEYGDEVLDDLALVTLGSRPFVAGFALSVHRLADQFRGKYLDAISYPKSFPETGLRYVDRVVTVRNEDPAYEPVGSRFRCVIVDPTYSTDQNARNLFGFGPHVCIGRQVSLMAWEELCTRFAEIHRTVEPGPLQVVDAEPFEEVVECVINLGSNEN